MKDLTIISVGELLVEFVSHRKGCELKQLSEYSGPFPSGAPAICIDQAARMGAQTRIVGSIGDDNFGNTIVERLDANGVDTTGVQKLSDKTTGVAFVSYYEDGSRTFIFHLHNTAADSISVGGFAVPAEPAVLHVSGSSLGNPLLRAAIESAADQVLKQGGKISCDPNARAELMKDQQARTALFKIIKNSHFLFPSDSDLGFLFPDKSEAGALMELQSYGAETVVVTRGEAGCTIHHGGKTVQLPGYSVDEVDPTGAGDCFCGTFLAMKASESSIAMCGKYANAAGAIAVTKRGPMEGNSDRETIEQFMQANSPNNPVSTP